MQLTLLEKKTKLDEKIFIDFLTNEGIIVKTNTKARGNLAICFNNRIDISNKVEKERRIAVLAHEYAHKIHLDIDKKGLSKGGTLEKIFNIPNTDIIKKELSLITNFVDKNSLFFFFYEKKSTIDKEITDLSKIIKKYHPQFQKSKDFNLAVEYIKKEKSDAIYLLKYDRIRIKGHLFKKEKFYSIDNIDNDFPALPEYVKAYLKILSLQRLYKRYYRKKNKAAVYYNKPTELFARFIEGFFIDKERVLELAPFTAPLFFNLLNQGYYGNMKKLFMLADLL